MKKLKKIKRKYKIPLAIGAFIAGALGLVLPVIPGIVLISVGVYLVKDYYKPLDMAIDTTVGVVGDVVEEIGDEVVEIRKKGWIKYIEGVRKRFVSFKDNLSKKRIKESKNKASSGK
uniref:Uncharacterized protein n=1 Tax=candidate division CPR3 bacterium TaxID=2268181 RepID=A0A7C4M3E9_UNCC3